jgi:hypothetical protein
MTTLLGEESTNYVDRRRTTAPEHLIMMRVVERKFFRNLLIASLMVVLSTQSTISAVHAASKRISFNLYLNYVEGTLSSDINIPTGSVEPGKSVAIGISANSEEMIILLNVPNVGQASMQIESLGERSYNVPGLYYDYMLVKLGLVLNAKGTITGHISATGQGAVDKSSLEWAGSGTRSVTLTAAAEAKIGDEITLHLSNIEYNLYIEVKAVGQVLGNYHEAVLVPYTNVGSVTGNPSALSSSYRIGKTGSQIAQFLLPISFGIIIIVIAVATISFASRKRLGSPKQPPLHPTFPHLKSCPYCGQIAMYNAQYNTYYCSRCRRYLK